jgi:hypothetical protein
MDRESRAGDLRELGWTEQQIWMEHASPGCGAAQ